MSRNGWNWRDLLNTCNTSLFYEYNILYLEQVNHTKTVIASKLSDLFVGNIIHSFPPHNPGVNTVFADEKQICRF